MDPATAFQVACGAVQLLEVGLKTIRSLQEIYKSERSLSTANEELFEQASWLQQSYSSTTARLASIEQGSLKLTEDQERLQEAAEGCVQLSHELLQKVESLNITGVKKKRDVPIAWVKARREKDAISRIGHRLQNYQNKFNTEMLINL